MQGFLRLALPTERNLIFLRLQRSVERGHAFSMMLIFLLSYGVIPNIGLLLVDCSILTASSVICYKQPRK